MKKLPERLRQYRASVTPNSGCWHGSDCITQAAVEIERLREALVECARLAAGSKEDFEMNQYRWLASIHTEAHRALSSEN